MPQEVTQIKARIKSVTGAYKVTSAMKLVSTVKLKKWKRLMVANRDYSSEIDRIAATILSYAKNVTSPFMQKNEKAKKDLYIIVSSTLGLCGSYNQNIFKLVDANICSADDAIILGKKGIVHYEGNQFKKLEGFETYKSSNDESVVRRLIEYLMSEYEKGTYKEIHLIYSSYKNSLVFNPTDYVLLPIKLEGEEKNNFGPILEPSPQTLVDELLPIYLRTSVHAKLLESEVCEQASRSNAMENATDNAKDILNKLEIEFNKARQAAITQEITEIVGAAEAL